MKKDKKFQLQYNNEINKKARGEKIDQKMMIKKRKREKEIDNFRLKKNLLFALVIYIEVAFLM